MNRFMNRGVLGSLALIVFSLLRMLFAIAIDCVLWFVLASLVVAPIAWLLGADDVREVSLMFGWAAAATSVPGNVRLFWRRFQHARLKADRRARALELLLDGSEQ